MLPVQNPKTTYHSLEELQARKGELLKQLNTDNTQFSTKWHQLFVPKEGSTKAEFVGGLIANSITAIDAFLVVRKLFRNYGSIFGLGKKHKK